MRVTRALPTRTLPTHAPIPAPESIERPAPIERLEQAAHVAASTPAFFVMLACPLIGLLIAAFILWRQPPTFQATGQIQLISSPLIPSGTRLRKRDFGDEIELLTSPTFLKQAVEALPLPDRTQLLSGKNRKHKLHSAEFVHNAPDFERIAGRFSVKQITSTAILEISYQGSDPHLAAAMVNAALSRATRANLSEAEDRVTRDSAFFADRLTTLQSQIDAAQLALSPALDGDLNGELQAGGPGLRSSKTASLLNTMSAGSKRAAKLRRRRGIGRLGVKSAAQNDPHDPRDQPEHRDPTLLAFTRAAAEADRATLLADARLRLSRVLQQAGSTPFLNQETAQQLQGLRRSLNQSQAEYAALTSTLGENQPEARAQFARIADLQAELGLEQQRSARGLATAAAAAHTDAANLNAARRDRAAAIARVLNAEARNAIADIDLAINLSLFDDLQVRLQSARFVTPLHANAVLILESAQVPLAPIAEPLIQPLAVGTAIGILVGFLVCLALYARSERFWSLIEIENALGLPVLATFPQRDVPPASPTGPPASNPSITPAKIPTTETPFTNALLRNHATESSFTSPLLELREALRFLGFRTAVASSSSPRPPRPKARPPAASSPESSFAAMLSRQGERVLLLDLTEPSSPPDATRPPNLLPLLRGDLTLDQAIQQTPHKPGLDQALQHTPDQPVPDILRAGKVSPRDVSLLVSPAMTALLESAGRRYTWIVLDAAPLLTSADTLALALAAQVDAVLIVAPYGQVPVRQVTAARNLLDRTAAPIAGLLLTNIPT